MYIVNVMCTYCAERQNPLHLHLFSHPLGGIDAVAPSSTTNLDEKKNGERRNFARKGITGHVGMWRCMVQLLPSSKLHPNVHPAPRLKKDADGC